MAAERRRERRGDKSWTKKKKKTNCCGGERMQKLEADGFADSSDRSSEAAESAPRVMNARTNHDQVGGGGCMKAMVCATYASHIPAVASVSTFRS